MVKTKKFKNIDNKLETSVTNTTVEVITQSLQDLNKRKDELVKIKQDFIESHNRRMVRHDNNISEAQKKIDEAVSLGIT